MAEIPLDFEGILKNEDAAGMPNNLLNNMESPDIVASLQMFQQQRSENKLVNSFYPHKHTYMRLYLH